MGWSVRSVEMCFTIVCVLQTEDDLRHHPIVVVVGIFRSGSAAKGGKVT